MVRRKDSPPISTTATQRSRSRGPSPCATRLCTHNGFEQAATIGEDEEESRCKMQEATTKAHVLRRPCGVRMQASDDGALIVMLGEHIEREHPYVDTQP